MNRYTELSKPPGHRSDLVKAEAREYYTALLRPLFEGRRFIHAGGLAVGLGREARTLAALGAAKPLILAYGEGTGVIPAPKRRYCTYVTSMAETSSTSTAGIDCAQTSAE